MRVEKQLTQRNQKAQNDKAVKRRRDDAPEDDQIEREQKVWHYINEGQGVFTSVMNSGINTQESVFDKYAVFRTKQEEGPLQ